MARRDEIEELLRQVTPLFLEVAEDAQRAADALGETDWAREHLLRTAAVNQVAGVARWRLTGDGLVARQDELPVGVELSTSDEEQNQGRYFLQARQLGIILTIRRKPHPPDEQPPFLQLQIAGVAELAPTDYGDEIVAYLAVPPLGTEPMFEVTTRGKEMFSLPLVALLSEEDDEGLESEAENLPVRRPSGTVVKSAIDADREERDEGEEGESQPDG